MPPAPLPASKEVAAFKDGLGERRTVVGPDGRPRTVLRLTPDLAAAGAFEFALRERVGRLSFFHHPGFIPVRGVERPPDNQAILAVWSDGVDAVRLSELLSAVTLRGLHFDLATGLAVLRQTVDALAALHETMPDVAHGALGPERMFVTPQGRVCISDYVLGAAVEQLRFSQQRYWRELRIALPRTAGHPTIDHRVDATQLGVVALSLILGRPLRDDEYPSRVGEVVGAAWAVSARGTFAPLPAGLRGWLGRALQLDPRNSFDNAIDARAELARVLANIDGPASESSLRAVVAQLTACTGPAVEPIESSRTTESPSSVGPTSETLGEERSHPVMPPPLLLASAASLELFDPEPALVDGAQSAPPARQSSARVIGGASKEARRRLSGSSDVTGSGTVQARLAPPVLKLRPATRDERRVRPDQVVVAQHEARAEAAEDRRRIGDRRVGAFRRQTATPHRALRYLGGLLALTVLIAGSVAAGRRLGATPSASRPTTGTLDIRTNPTGARVAVDGEPRGSTPITLTLAEGPHQVNVSAQGQSRTLDVSITPGSLTAQFIELPQPPPAPAPPAQTTGSLELSSEPAGLEVVIDSVPRGVTPTTLTDLPPGEHIVVIKAPKGEVRRVVSIEAGVSKSVTVPIPAAESGRSAHGWVSVQAPVDVEVKERGRRLERTGSGRVALAPGRHDLEFVNDAIGFTSRRTLEVMAGQATSVRLSVPTGTLAVNASPWADVWVDGRPVGQTPLSSISVAVGQHEVTLRHPELGERRHHVTVEASEPARLTVNLREP